MESPASRFPCPLAFWQPPPRHDHPRWQRQTLQLSAQITPIMTLSSIGLALCVHGASKRVSFLLLRSAGAVSVTFPSSGLLDIDTPQPAECSTPAARAAVVLTNNYPAEELCRLAASMGVPLLLSYQCASGICSITAFYDILAVQRSEVGWFLIHVHRALDKICPGKPAFNGVLDNAVEYEASENLLISSAEKQLFSDLERFSRKVPDLLDFPPYSNILHHSLVNTVKSTPLSVAFCCSGETTTDMTYEALYAAAYHLGIRLQHSGVRPCHIVPIVATSVLQVAVSMLAVLLIGAAYTITNSHDLDNMYILLALGEARSPVVVGTRKATTLLDNGFRIIDPRSSLRKNTLDDVHDKPLTAFPTVEPGNRAYVFFRAGKSHLSAVQITHAQSTELLRTTFGCFKVTRTSCVWMKPQSPCLIVNDMLWNTFAHGGTICVLDHGTLPIIQSSHCHHSHIVLESDPATLASLLQSHRSVRANSTSFEMPLVVTTDSLLVSPLNLSAEDVIEYSERDMLMRLQPKEEKVSIDTLYKSENTLLDGLGVLSLLHMGTVIHRIGSIVVKIGNNLAVKYGACLRPVEAASMIFVRENTRISVPAVHLVFRHEKITYIVMDYIPGQCLDKVWDGLHDFSRSSVLSQLALYMQQLRDLKCPSLKPGPLDNSRCRGPWFTSYDTGPFDSHPALVAWLNHKHKESGRSGADFDDSYDLVFTHQDLAPRNAILDEEGRLWLIDWELAGWYPEYFEYACVASGSRTPDDWKKAVLGLLQPYEKEHRALDSIRWSLERNAFG